MPPLRIAVIANCQSTGIGRVLRYCLEDVQVSVFRYNDIPSIDFAEGIFSQLSDVDIVFAQPQEQECFGPLRTSLLRGQKFELIVFPPVVFQGFHPDMTLFKGMPRDWRGPLHTSHSRIIAAAFLKGYTVSETVDLFNAFTYARVGYFDAYQQAQDNLMRVFRGHKIDLESHFNRWLRHGAFMYTFNHPKLVVLSSIAEELCRIAQLPLRVSSQTIDMVPDDLQNGMVWPVYPEIATRLGFDGGTIFKDTALKGKFKYFSIKDNVDNFFACYKSIDPTVIRDENVLKVLDAI